MERLSKALANNRDCLRRSHLIKWELINRPQLEEAYWEINPEVSYDHFVKELHLPWFELQLNQPRDYSFELRYQELIEERTLS